MKKRVLTFVLMLALCFGVMGTALATDGSPNETVIYASDSDTNLWSLLSRAERTSKNTGTANAPVRIVLEGKDYTIDSGFHFYNCSNVTIEGTTGTRILCTSSLDLVIAMSKCTGFTLKNLVLGHELPTEEGCSDGVLEISNSEVTLLNCDIFGCGLVGISSYYSTIKAYNTVIRDCSKSIMEISDSNAQFQDCAFSGNGYEEPDQYGVEGYESNLIFADCVFVDNGNPNFYNVSYFDATDIAYDTSIFYNNAWGNDNVDTRPEITAGPSASPSIPDSSTPAEDEYIYDTPDPGEEMTLPASRLDTVDSMSCAVEAVGELTRQMSAEQKSSPTCIDLATLYAETAAAKATHIRAGDGDILIDSAAVKSVSKTAIQARDAVEEALNKGGVSTVRELSSTVTVVTYATDFTIQIAPDILDAGIDKVRVETAFCAITFKLADLRTDLTETLAFDIRISDSNPAARTNSDAEVDIAMPKDGRLANPITVSLPSGSGEKTYKTVADAKGAAIASKYNPATTEMDGKVNASGKYSVKTNQKDFSDISNKSAEMQKAIRYLASKGIIAGKTATIFEPNGSINRAEIATLLVKSLGKLDSSATASFADVTKSNWYYTAAASSQKRGLIKGFEDRTFRGTTSINKVQIVAVSSRVLTSEMNYKTPSDPQAYLTKYSDSVSNWARPEVALATRENLVLSRKDGTFSGNKTMTRGDAAIIIYRLFQRIW